MSLWLIPAVAVAGAAGAAQVLIAVDRALSPGGVWPVFGGGAESARNLLSVIAGSMVTSISLIFSVTMVVLQLASAQYSPRVLRSFIGDRVVQGVLGVYIATFVYALLVLPAVRNGEGAAEEFVPSLAVTGALVLALVSLGVFVRYIHHIAHSIRAVTVITTIAAETRAALESMYPDELGEEAPEEAVPPSGPATDVLHWNGEPGVLVAVDESALMEAAVEAGIVVSIVPMVGAFIPTASAVLEVSGPAGECSALLGCVSVGGERTMHQDAAFGFRQLVDIAERALSPGVNDPTTAVQAVDQLHDLLRRLGDRRFPSRTRLDESGAVRVIAPRLDWDDYVRLAFDEIRQYGSHSIQVVRRLHGAVDDLLAVVPASRRAALEQQRDLLAAAAAREFPDAPDEERAGEATLLS